MKQSIPDWFHYLQQADNAATLRPLINSPERTVVETLLREQCVNAQAYFEVLREMKVCDFDELVNFWKTGRSAQESTRFHVANLAHYFSDLFPGEDAIQRLANILLEAIEEDDEDGLEEQEELFDNWLKDLLVGKNISLDQFSVLLKSGRRHVISKDYTERFELLEGKDSAYSKWAHNRVLDIDLAQIEKSLSRSDILDYGTLLPGLDI